MLQKEWFVYIVETSKGRLYTGITVDLERRFEQHQGLLPGGAKFFRSDSAKSLVWWQKFPNRSGASREEARIKKLGRAQKQALIQTKRSR